MSGETRRMTCSSCGAPLAPQIEGDNVPCAHCGKRHTSIVPPPPDSYLAPSLEPGDAVAVLWEKRWWPARIVKVETSDRFLVHYDGWGPTFDEVVESVRVRPLTANDGTDVSDVTANHQRKHHVIHDLTKVGLALVVAVAVVVILGYWAVSNQAGTTPSGSDNAQMAPSLSSINSSAAFPINTRPIADNDRLTRNQSVFVLLDTVWYPAKITAITSDGNIAVHLTQWDRDNDILVTRQRLRIAR